MIEVTSSKQIGEFIKAARKQSRIRLIDAALLSGISHPVLSKIERGLDDGDVDAFTSLFSLLTQMGVQVSIGSLDSPPVQVETRQDFAREVIKKRKSQGITQSDAAGLIGLSAPTLGKIESPTRSSRKPSDVRLSTLLKVLRGLGLRLFLDRPE